ncbi:MAG: methyltransferase domain-containing protein [Rhodospirillaceae bacterium]|nr:methyltransferase domain-containing protein [Rhodospirillaceae bacterium]
MNPAPDIWNPKNYLNFASHRTRPAIDLLSHINIENPSSLIDLGCGAGNVTAILRQRWANAEITAIDNSPAMLEHAGEKYFDQKINWKLDDIDEWSLNKKGKKFDIVFSNAALHWLGGHKNLFPRLMTRVNSGGMLAVQMPNNFSAPSHKLMAQTISDDPWAELLKDIAPPTPVAWPAAYKGWLHPLAKNIDVWETQYVQYFEGEDPVLKWISGSWLAPVLARLSGNMRESFIALYGQRLRDAYPPDADGRTVYKMRRTFILALKD